MADTSIGIKESNAPTKQVDAESLLVGGAPVVRERNRIAGAAAGDLAPVDPTYGLAVDQKRSVLEALVGPTNEAAPASNSAPSGLNGLLRRLLSPLATIGTTPLFRVAIMDGANAQVTSFGGVAGAVLNRSIVSLATTNPTVVKNSPGKLRGLYAYNRTTGAQAKEIWVKFHDLATAPTAGTTPVVMKVGFQSGVPFAPHMPGGGVAFAAGLALTIVTGYLDNDATAVAAGDLVLEVFYE